MSNGLTSPCTRTVAECFDAIDWSTRMSAVDRTPRVRRRSAAVGRSCVDLGPPSGVGRCQRLANGTTVTCGSPGAGWHVLIHRSPGQRPSVPLTRHRSGVRVPPRPPCSEAVFWVSARRPPTTENQRTGAKASTAPTRGRSQTLPCRRLATHRRGATRPDHGRAPPRFSRCTREGPVGVVVCPPPSVSAWSRQRGWQPRTAHGRPAPGLSIGSVVDAHQAGRHLPRRQVSMTGRALT